MTPAERLRDIPAAAKQRALDEPVSMSAYTEDHDFQSKDLRDFMMGVFWTAIAALAFTICHAAILWSK